MTLEKILAASTQNFICLVDSSKKNKLWTQEPLPLEVLDFAKSMVIRELIKIGGSCLVRPHEVTDSGHMIIDVTSLSLEHPLELETYLNNIPGVVGHGLFVTHRPKILLIGSDDACEVINIT